MTASDNREVVKTACSLCHLACGLKVYLEQGRIVHIEGLAEHPLNEGITCPKGRAAVRHFYSSERLKHPLKRQGGSWRQISWDEALDIIAFKLEETKEKYGAKAFAVAIGMPVLLAGSITVSLIRKLCYIFGSPNCFSVESMCYRCRILGYISVFGRYYCPDPENSDLILLWGHNPGNSNPGLVAKIARALRKGARLAVIDPRRTPLSGRADMLLQPRPGTDGALALSLMQVIISEKLYDEQFVGRWTIGFDRLAEHVEQYTPEKVEEISWVRAEDIRRLARLLATIKPASILQGINSLDQQASGFDNARAIATLQALTGNVGVQGGFIRAPGLRENSISMPPLEEKAIGQPEHPVFFGLFGREFGEGQAMFLPDVLLSGKPYPIKTMFVAGSNPLLTWPNSSKVRRAFEKLDFLVVMDQFMSETAELADLILPAATFLERNELCDYYHLWGLPYVMLRKKLVEYEECWPDAKFWLELAHRLGYEEEFPWASVEEVIDWVLQPSGLSVERLTRETPEGLFYSSVKERDYERGGFRTPSGKVELYSQTLADLGHSPLPTFREPPEGPLSTPELSQEYPLVLTTGARSLEFTHSQLRNIPDLRWRNPEPLAEIHPETGWKYGLANGEPALVETRRGSLEIKVKFTEDIHPGVICLPHGWAEANVNLLTDETPADPVVGYPSLKASLCRVRRP